VKQVIDAGQRAEQIELLGQDPLHVLAPQRTDCVFLRGAGVETLADLFLLLRRKRKSSFAATAVVQSRQAFFVVPPHPTLADATRQTDRHRHRRRRPPFDSKNDDPQPLGAIGVLLDSCQPLQLRQRQMILHLHRNLLDCARNSMMGAMGGRKRRRATSD
jgi:hypothetical protein